MVDPTQGGLFRAFTMPGRKLRGEWQAASMDIGTRSTCALNLPGDPVIAARHCTIHARGKDFVLEDLGSATGTWHNGSSVSSPVELRDGDQVVVGVSRLSFELKQEEGRSVLEVLVEESGFHYKRPKPGEFHTDADEWVRSEVRFGRIPAVRGASWTVGLLAFMALVWAFSTDRGERLLQPGALDGSHAAMLGAPMADFAGKASGHANCGSCHGGTDPGDVASCAVCHEVMSSRHPFYDGSVSDQDLRADVARPADGCRMCHEVGHNGLSPSESKESARAKLREGIPEETLGWGVCRECHTGGFGMGSKEEVEAAIKERIQTIATQRQDPALKAPSTSHEYGFEEFSHSSHLSRGLDCSVCHVADKESAASVLGIDFKGVAFSTCAACHVEGMPTPESLPGIDSAALTAMRATLKREALVKTMDWHGRGSQCLQCHAQDDQRQPKPELKSVERELAQKTYGIVRMGHQQHALTAGPKADCAACHGDLKSLEGSPEVTRSAKFLHGTHIETLWPATDADKARLSKESCESCHTTQWDSRSILQGARVELGVACRTCHTDPARPETEGRVTERTESRRTEKRTEFPHQAHAKLEGGCFACHVFNGASDEDPRATPGLLEGVQDCIKCHYDHQNIAGNACSFCHPAGAAAGSGSAVLFRGKRPVREDWPAAMDFNHFAGGVDRGHMEFMGLGGERAEPGCAKCHDMANLKQATLVSEVEIPGSRGSLCVDCHAFNRGWFHWSLPNPTAR